MRIQLNTKFTINDITLLTGLLVANILLVKLYVAAMIHLYNQTTVTKLPIWPLLIKGVESNTMQTLSHLLFSPVAETLIFQTLTFHLIHKHTKNTALYIGSSATFFAAFHLFGSSYKFGYALIGGFFFAYCFSHFYRKYGLNGALVSTVGLHSACNLFMIFF